jgi:hypothetical protein
VAGKQYVAIRWFRQTDPRTGNDTIFEVGDPYSGPLDLPYLLDQKGPDGRGPLIAEKSTPTASSASDSGGKEK